MSIIGAQGISMVIALLGLGGIYLFFKKKQLLSNPYIQVKSVYYLGRQERLVFAELEGQAVVLGVTAHQITLLTPGATRVFPPDGVAR